MSLEQGDLRRLVHAELHIDDYRAKMGENRDVIVVSFKVAGKEPADDLVSFIEKSYDWILDADVSSGEMSDGDYLVFVEVTRERQAPENIMKMMEDLMNLTDQDLTDWRVRYYHGLEDHDMDVESLKSLIPTEPEEYDRRYGQREIDSLKTASGIPVDTKAPKNAHTESIRVLAGLR